jgi:alkanesulfonate monooxygenase SsuD/methylene tetrahydromethanopterin reductase-like flavin-dependent oxidoreductase (luciferase family)
LAAGLSEVGHVAGSAAELIDHFGERRDQGIERVYVWTTDFADPAHLAELGETVDFDGTYHSLEGACQSPPPLDRIPIVIGGAGPRTLDLVARFADWWNCPLHRLDRFDEMRERTGSARPSIQERVTFVPAGGDREEIVATASRRFGELGHVTGSAEELLDHYGRHADDGIERIYVWTTDFAEPDTIAEFGECVIAALD